MTDRIGRFVEAVKDDPRVLGVARMPNPAGLPRWVHALVVTTWDGYESLPRELARAVRDAWGDAPARVLADRDGACSGLGADGVRIDVELRRVGDLRPERQGVGAEALFDPRGLVAQWIRYCTAAHGEEPSGCPVPDRDDRLAHADLRLRLYESERVLLLPEDGGELRHVRPALRDDDPVESAVAARIDALLRALPRPGAGDRILGGSGRSEWLEEFLAIADGEGFKGDRMLFGEAMKRLRELSDREPVFEEGFVLPTFDAVEASFSVGEVIDACGSPLVPGVHVGVGVTPKDALEFWAAPCVRIPNAPIAFVDDLGDRDVVLRTAGRDPMVASLTRSIDGAWDRLPALVERARESANESVDHASVFASLHLPRSFVERARRFVGDAPTCSRFAIAVSLARAAHDCAPLVARKLALAAGRVLANR